MSISIKHIHGENQSTINYRTMDVNGVFVRSINVNQINGGTVTTSPLVDKINIYSQSPNNESYQNIEKDEILGYGELNFPCDASFNHINSSIWIANAGDNNVLKISSKDYSLASKIDNIILPHAIAIDNRGGTFIKSFSGVNTGIIYHYNSKGEMISYISFPNNLNSLNTEIERSSEFLNRLPLPSSICYDNSRERLWWTADDSLYMADIKNKQVIHQNLSPNYTDLRGVDIHYSSGNAFVTCRNSDGFWSILQVFKDNNKLFCNSYISWTEGDEYV